MRWFEKALCYAFVLTLIFKWSSAKQVTFWQLTDVHVDLLYDVNGDPKNLCHKNSSENLSNAGKFGNYKCEANWDLLNSALDFMKSEQSNPDFILWTGDTPPHWRHPPPGTFISIFKKRYSN